MIQGIYRDQVHNNYDRLVFDSGWSPNTIVDAAWPLIAGLLKNDPALNGILFWAVGAGDPTWDAARATANPAATQLQDEIERQAVPVESIVYLDSNGIPVESPTTWIEVSASFTWPAEAQTLREFGLFGGNASKVKNSGYLINYVIHPRLELEAGATLTRHLRLSLRPEVGPERLEVPQHWLGASPVADLDGVGEAYTTALADAGIGTVGELASAEPTALSIALPLMKLVELRAKARLTLRAAADLTLIAGLLDRTAWEIIVTPTATLAADVGASEEAVQRLREQVSALQLTLDNQVLQRVTIGELAQSL